jgi:subtilisin family serine protease
MARYVLSQRRVGVTDPSRKAAIRADASQAFSTLFADNVDVVGISSPEEETKREVIVFDANPAEVAAKREELSSDVILEREILHFPATVTLPADSTRVDGLPIAGIASTGTGQTLTITVRGPSGPLENAEVLLTLRAVGTQLNTLTARSDPEGQVSFEFGAPWSPAALVALPAGNHWAMILRGPEDGDVVETPELPETADVWWHQVVSGGDDAGAGVAVGVADTGVGPHPHVQHVTSVGAFIGGNHLSEPQAGLDVDSHGTHVCGTIGARPTSGALRPPGVAPAADVACARVFPDADSGANQGDIANAIDHLSEVRRVDLINLSLGAPQGSQIEREAIVEALERGTLVMCAAANSAGPVNFPAAFSESIAVSALGLQGWGPQGSLSASRYPSDQTKYGRDQLYLANFSCFGPQIDCGAPGVGIIAPVPERFGLSAPYGAMDGTSMASPVACGALAAALSRSSEYLELPRDLTRAAQARAVLEAGCRDIGLATQFQGRGVPQAKGSTGAES